MDKQRIGITGASDTIGRLLATGLTGTHRLALFDRRPLPISEPYTANSHDCFTQIDLTHRDCLALFRCAIQVGAPFVLAYGISANTHTIFGLAETRQVLDYAPQDNAERRFAE